MRKSCLTPWCSLLAAGVFLAGPGACVADFAFGLTNQTWKYWDQDSDPGPDWAFPAFDDTAWPAGLALLAFENNGALVPLIHTTLRYNAYNPRGHATYFRTHFTYSGITTGAILTLSNRVDDGAVFYLNGAEIGRVRVTANPVTFTSFASGLPPSGEATGWDVFSWTNDASLLVEGDNTLAVVLLTESATSSDIVFGSALSTIVPGQPVVIEQQPAAADVVEPQPVVFSVVARGTPPYFYQWFRDGVALPGATDSSYAIPHAHPALAGTYHVEVRNDVNSLSSDPATLTVAPDVTPPVMLGALLLLDQNHIVVNFSEPLDPIVASDPLRFSVALTSGGGDLSIYEVVPQDETNLVLTVDPATPNENYTLTLVEAVADIAEAPNFAVVPAEVLVATETRLLAIDDFHLWRYDESGTPLDGTGWETPTFDDTAWPLGAAVLGQETAATPEPIRTDLQSIQEGGPRTTYFRTHFLLPSPTAGVRVTMRHIVDDGMVVYLNGQEAYRIGVPVGQVFSTEASRTVGDGAYEGPFEFPASNLVAGDNLLAVEVHQAGANSSDIQIGIELTAVVPRFITGPPNIVVQPQSATVVEGASAVFTVSAEGALPLTYQWYYGAAPLPDATNATLILSRVKPSHFGAYVVLVRNPQGAAFSDVANLTVIADVTPASVTTAAAVFGGGPGTNILVSFSEALDAPSAQDTNHYVLDGGSLPVLGAAAVNPMSVLLTTAPLTLGSNYTLHIDGVKDQAEAGNVTVATVALPSLVQLIGINDTQTWRYNDLGTDLGAAWHDPGYDDGLWSTGQALFDAKRPPRDTNLYAGEVVRTIMNLTNAAGTEQVLTFYFRTHFDFPPNAQGTVLRLRHVLDDGAAFFLNGLELVRIGMTNEPPDQPPAYTNLASRSVGDATLEPPRDQPALLLPADSLLAGDNVLAVEVHQTSPTSSDVTLGLELEALVTHFGFGASRPMMTIRSDGAGNVILMWPGGGTLLEAQAVDGSWVEVSGATSPYTVPATGPAKFFRVNQP